ncbi:MAG: adenylate/guanylate cyclase domain-containing protein [Deltaproteobacteria bacterium]|nr:adenylate/guanylate cyclase domain-containing protein [Deltaproteobacteria bacterium]
MPLPRLTLGRFIALCFAALAALLAVLLSVFYRGSRDTILLASEQLMGQASRRVTERIEAHLSEAERLVESFEWQVDLGLVDTDRLATIESALIGELTSHPRVTEATLTYGRAVGVYEADDDPHDAGDLRLAPGRSGQVSVSRVGAESDAGVVVRRLRQSGRRWLAEERRLPYETAPHPAAAPAIDPTVHATFTVPSRAEHRRRALWSDLSYSEADAALAEPLRRRVVSVQKALWSNDEAFFGVLRVSLLNNRVDEFTRVQVGRSSPAKDDHVVFLCDRHGRLISRLGPADRFALLDPDGRPDPDGDVRVVPASPPPPVAAALRAAVLRDVPPGGSAVARIEVSGASYLVSVSALLGGRTQGWLVGIVVPEAYYLSDLEASRRRALLVATLLMAASVAGGALVLRAVRRDLGRLIGELRRLSGFEFAPSAGRASTFRDVQEASESLEQAKTALRALGKYVPLDLVRQLYHARVEPMLGGRLQDVTLLFSDIEGFTTLSEQLSPNALAVALGAYLEAMTRAIHSTGGIIDKYTGDGVMALWNTPSPAEHHALRACEAALACERATRALFATEAWAGLPPWRTRFGIHRAEVNVGHFGAPDRMSFTALGDGVNLASRLESLNKHYGTRILVSAPVEREGRATYRFRRLDRVAVKGKREGVEIFELVGRRDEPAASPACLERYEQALDAYFGRRFGAALALLDLNADDPPSRVLAARCREFAAAPPAAEWDGIYAAREK